MFHAFTNEDGDFPYAGLVLCGNSLYGATDFGGAYGKGTLFEVDTNGNNFTVIHTFSQLFSPFHTNTDGAHSEAALVCFSNTLFGTATAGGPFGQGTLFSITTGGSDFKVLHAFTGGWDGNYPLALLISGGVLYGVTEVGGANDTGVIYTISADGSDFKVLYSFDAFQSQYTNFSGVYPEGVLALSNNTLYGMTEYGGTYGNGTVFSLSLPGPQLSITHAGAYVILSWPTNSVGFTLQSTTNLVPPTIWTTNSPAPVVVNGQHTVTNPISGTQQFYRLSQ